MTKKEKVQEYLDEDRKAYKRKDYNATRNNLEKAISHNPNDAKAYNSLALVLATYFKEYEKAKQYFEKALEINPDFADIYYNFAVLLVEHFQKYEKAKQYFEKAIEINPNNTEVYYNIADLLENHFQEYEKAKQYYEKAIKINPNNSKTYYNFAILLVEHFQEYEKAKQYYEKAIEINPNNVKAYYNYAILLSQHFNEFKKAEQYLSKYILFSNPKIVKKVKQISLNDYNQFERNTKIDLTYPKGHPKAGQPLDKVCFIGQSGTGKTSILELIKGLYTNKKANIPNADFNSVYLKYNFYDFENKISLINFPAHSVENIKKLDSKDILEYKSQKLPSIIDFEKEDPKKHWYPILKEITEYQAKAVKYSSELGYDTLNDKNYSSIKNALDNYYKKINELKKTNNSLENLDNFLRPIFSKFHLKVNTEPSDPEEIKFIPIESISNEQGKEKRENIQTQFLSTGTKEILSRTVPLFALKPRNTIILIDEPENSLYPNVQKEFIDFITKESWNNIKTCQFFFATHSPTIASSFDPWEIIELKFNDDGKVKQKLYYEGERHVDNFTIFPKYLDIDSILLRLFEIDDIHKSREEFIDEFADYNIKIRKLEQKQLTNTTEYNDLITKRNELGRKLDWRIEK